MATIERPVAQPGISGRREVAESMPSPSRAMLIWKTVLAVIWAIWLAAWLLMIVPYLPGLLGGLSTLLAALPGMILGFAYFIFNSIPAFLFTNVILGSWSGMAQGTRDLLTSGWAAVLFGVLGAVVLAVVWPRVQRLRVTGRGFPFVAARFGFWVVRFVVNVFAFLVGLAVLFVLSYGVGLARDLFDYQGIWFPGLTGWFALAVAVVGGALVYLGWRFIDNLPTFTSMARVVVSALAVVVALELLVALSYPLQWLSDGANTLLGKLPQDFLNFVSDAWYVVPVLAVGALLVIPLWAPWRTLGVIIIAGIIVWAHTFGWFKSQIAPTDLIKNADKMQKDISDLLTPDIIGRDQQSIQFSATTMVGSAQPPANGQPVTLKSTLVPVASETSKNKEIPPDLQFNAQLYVSAENVTPGQQIEVKGSGFRPSTLAALAWVKANGSYAQPLGTVTTDAKGTFDTTLPVPSDPERVINPTNDPNSLIVTQTWDVGNPYITDTFNLVLDKIIETLFLALMGTTFAVIISLPLSFLAAQNLMSHNAVSRAIYVVARTVLNVLRSVEVLIMAVIFVAAVGVGPFAGVLALALHSIASLGKLYSEAIEAIDPGPIEAVTTTGANRLQVIRYAVVPQFIPQFVSFTLYRWDMNVRMSTIIGFVGGGGIGFILNQYIGLLQWHAAGSAILMIAIVVIAMDYASAKIRMAVV